MARLSLSEQLNNYVEAISAGSGTPPPVDSRIAALAHLATELLGLPRAQYKDLLRHELERKAASTVEKRPGSAAGVTALKGIREGFRTVTPYIAVREAQQVIDFVKTAFGAKAIFVGTGSQGGIHSEFRIGDSMIMIGGGPKFQGPPKPATLHLYVEDVDAVYERALRAGATSLMAPTDQDYGDRDSAIRDVAGNEWYLATHKGTSYLPEGSNNLMPYFHPRGAVQMIDFLRQAFGAREAGVYQSPEGAVHHAKLIIGNSLIEMGEAHGQWQPATAMMFVYVDDVDATYQRAISAGGEARDEPSDQPYGDRVGAVADPFGNIWYIATPISDRET